VSESPEGPGWWQASDGKWYPPEQAPGYQAGAGAGGAGAVSASGGTDLGSVFTYSWNKFIQNIGEWLVLWLILVVAVIVLSVIAVAVAIGGSVGGFAFSFSPVGIIFGVLRGAVIGILLVVIAKGAVQATNGEKVDVAACFKLTGNNIVAGLVFGVIYGLLTSFCSIFGIAAWLFFGFLPALSALDDKGADAASESINISTQHAGEAMLFMLIGWFIGGVVCSLGAPIVMIGAVYMIKRYRGEAVAA
jgi:hypothetical protein